MIGPCTVITESALTVVRTPWTVVTVVSAEPSVIVKPATSMPAAVIEIVLAPLMIVIPASEIVIELSPTESRSEVVAISDIAVFDDRDMVVSAESAIVVLAVIDIAVFAVIDMSCRPRA